MAAVTGGVLVAGVVQTAIAPFVSRFREALPPLVTGLVVTMIGQHWRTVRFQIEPPMREFNALMR